MLGRLLWLLSFFLAALFGFVTWIVLSTPGVDAIKGCMKTELFQVWLCDDPTNANYVRLSEISPYLKNAVLISEDAAFYGHSGFDWDELRNSLELNLSRGRAVRGGSTITQQLAKNVFLTNEKTLTRKLREALLTVQIETLLTKEKIFEKYLNVIELGPNIYGVEAAARYYFKKSARNLNLLESAYLTFLIPNPKVYSKSFTKSELTKFGQYRVLDICFRLAQVKRISTDQYVAAQMGIAYFPWLSLPEDIIVGLAGASAPVDIHESIEESAFDNKGPVAAPEPIVESDSPFDQSPDNLPPTPEDPNDPINNIKPNHNLGPQPEVTPPEKPFDD